MPDEASGYLGPEAQARVEIDRQLLASGWVVQRYRDMNLGAGRGVAVREFPMAEGHGDADYLLFVDRKAVGVIEAKKKGSTLTGVEWQSAKYTAGLPLAVPALTRPLAFAYESTGVETRFTNGFDPEPASRAVFSFHRPETLADWVRIWSEFGGIERATLRQRVRSLPRSTRRGSGRPSRQPSRTWRCRSATSDLAPSSRWPPGRATPSRRPTSPTARFVTPTPPRSCSWSPANPR